MAVVVAVAVAAAVAAVPHRSVVVVRAVSPASRVNLASRAPNSLPLLPCRPRPHRFRKYSSHALSSVKRVRSHAKRGLIVRHASVGRSNVASGAGNIEASPVANTGASAVRSVITSATTETRPRVWAITCRRSSLVARTPCRPSSSW